jgi:hypothetical protein
MMPRADRGEIKLTILQCQASVIGSKSAFLSSKPKKAFTHFWLALTGEDFGDVKEYMTISPGSLITLAE